MNIFAAIDIGSYEIEMKIFELSLKYGMKEIDNIRARMELGKAVFRTGTLDYELIDEICDTLTGFIEIINSYQTDAYRVCATSALRDSKGSLFILEQIFLRTGIKVEILSNAEQRFLGYKSIASKEQSFNKIIQKGTAIVDIGGGSIQISLFNKDKLVTTQNIKAGSLRIRERLAAFENESVRMNALIEELINYELKNFRRLFLKDEDVKNLIMVGDYVPEMVKYAQKLYGEDTFSKEAFEKLYQEMIEKAPLDIAMEFDIPKEQITVFLPAVVIFKRVIDEMGIETLWSPGISLCDGIAFDYAQKNKLIKVQHNFEYDILAEARNVAKRYQCNKAHYSNVEDIAVTIFDSMRKMHGMSKRDRLLLRLAAILHSCGKYISLSDGRDSSYHIVNSTEIIGLSTTERKIVANIVRLNPKDRYQEDFFKSPTVISKSQIILIAKLASILRVANALDRSHMQKFKNIHVTVKDGYLTITVDTSEDITLERVLLPEKAAFFESVFHLKVIIKHKKYLQS